jgi:hypothetical protein
MTQLIELRAPRARFARSLNVERDAGSDAIDGYLPVGRAIDAVARLAAALDQDDVEVALSITGPYGSGKSSLALLIDALLGPATDRARSSAEELLSHADPQTLEKLRSARRRLKADRSGFIRAVVTAQREPVVHTVIRALAHGVERFRPPARLRTQHARLQEELWGLLQGSFESGGLRRLEVREVRELVAAAGKLAPVLLLIDEFGKNLEAFADAPNDADLFLLQELAEWSRGGDGLPLAVVTLQHMAFDEYASGTSAVQRREWAKVQGRFEDIPFVDSPKQTRALIGAAFDTVSAGFPARVGAWSAEQSTTLRALGLSDLGSEPEMLAACWPLHPVALALLPDLCERYGQNERTLFSFLAGHEPLSVASFLRETPAPSDDRLPVVRLDRVYDYFIDSAATMVAVSSAASRWVEIDTRIRDARGLSDAERRVLKAVGLLNLVSAGGPLRASADLVAYAASDGEAGTEDETAVHSCLAALESVGLVTYREFADEYRVWSGSDFDLRSALEIARRRLRDQSDAGVLSRVLPLGPLVAARHSHQTGTLRVFERRWVDPGVERIEPLGSSDRPDGSLLFVLGEDAPIRAVAERPDGKPILMATSASASAVVDAAREVAAINEVLDTTDELAGDWVAKRELLERGLEAQRQLEQVFEEAYGAGAEGQLTWVALDAASLALTWHDRNFSSASAAVSAVADEWFVKAPQVRNDLVNRHELSSQAAKARRLLMEAMLTHADSEQLGIGGFGPDRTMYLSVLAELGLHQRIDGQWAFTPPPKKSSIRPAWDHLNRLLDDAVLRRRRVSDLYEELAVPPYGVRAGVAPILLLAALLVRADDVALYEHGTFRPAITLDVCERFIRNPGNFEVKYFASRAGGRAELLTALADRMGVAARRGTRNGRVGSVLAVLGRLVQSANNMNDFARRTTRSSILTPDAQAVRKVLLVATEPDELLFRLIPEVLGHEPIGARSAPSQDAVNDVARRVAQAVREFERAYPRLLEEVRGALSEELRAEPSRVRESLSVRAQDISGKVIDPRVARLVVALAADLPGDDEWAEYVAMNLTGTPPSAWTDVDCSRFTTQLRDLGSTFRRIEALNTELRSRSDGYEALRVTVTRPDGAEAAKLVWVDEPRRDALAPVIEEALLAARQHASSDAEARDLLLALVADLDLSRSAGEIAGDLSDATGRVATIRMGRGDRD